jgi:hypothetical protein
LAAPLRSAFSVFGDEWSYQGIISVHVVNGRFASFAVAETAFEHLQIPFHQGVTVDGVKAKIPGLRHGTFGNPDRDNAWYRRQDVGDVYVIEQEGADCGSFTGKVVAFYVVRADDYEYFADRELPCAQRGE